MAELPSMDDILRDSVRNERRSDLKLGLFLVGAGLVVAVGLRALVSGGGITYYAAPVGTIVYGVMRIARSISG
jgi:hypothetical protein